MSSDIGKIIGEMGDFPVGHRYSQIGLPGLVNIQKAMENGPFIDGLPLKNGDFL